jgi:ABC-type branched-subunit amino acid transport system substrate-binding protein
MTHFFITRAQALPKSSLYALFVALSVALLACQGPDIDSTLWRCTTSDDCEAGYVCASSRSVCVKPDNSAEGVEADSITIGLSAPLSASVGQGLRAGVEAYFSSVNADGGLDGRTLKLLSVDDGDDPSRAAQNISQMVSDKSVFALLGCANPEGSLTALTDAKKLLFAPFSGAPEVHSDPPSRYVFNLRVSAATEARELVDHLAGLPSPIKGGNVALFAAAANGQLTASGQSTEAAIKAALKDTQSTAAEDVPVLTYAVGTVDTDDAVGEALQWLASGLARNGSGQVEAAFILAGDARASAALIRDTLDELFKIKRGTSSGLEFGLTATQTDELLNVSELVFVAASVVDTAELAKELKAFGTYETLSGEASYCASVIGGQAVPPIDSGAAVAVDFRDHLSAYGNGQLPSPIAFEGYMGARLLVEAIKQQSPALNSEGLVSLLDSFSVDLGTGAPIAFSPSDRQGLDRLWGVQLDAACALAPMDLLDPKDVPVPVDTSCPNNICPITGTITENKTLTSNKTWLLRGPVFIGDGTNETVLTIQPGTTILGDKATTGVLVIRKGSKIAAEGTREAPIIMTSSEPVGSRAPGDWGGLILNGNAPINGCDTPPCEAFGEGGTGFYGGSDPDDNSGVLKYVRVEFAGRLFSPDNELNGISFQGVGRGTTVDFVQVHQGQDDGVEFFGGTVDVRHLLVTAPGDDCFDWTLGWSGRAQYVVAQQWPDTGDQGIEADNNGNEEGTLRDSLPRALPTLSNFTLIGSPESSASDLGVLLREGTGARLHNVIVMGFNEACFDIDHAETFANAFGSGGTPTGQIVFESSILNCVTPFVDGEAEDTVLLSDFFNAQPGSAVIDPLIKAPYNISSPDYRPGASSPALSGGVAPGDAFFEATTFIGGVDPNMDWTVGWTTTAPN